MPTAMVLSTLDGPNTVEACLADVYRDAHARAVAAGHLTGALQALYAIQGLQQPYAHMETTRKKACKGTTSWIADVHWPSHVSEDLQAQGLTEWAVTAADLRLALIRFADIPAEVSHWSCSAACLLLCLNSLDWRSCLHAGHIVDAHHLPGVAGSHTCHTSRLPLDRRQNGSIPGAGQVPPLQQRCSWRAAISAGVLTLPDGSLLQQRVSADGLAGAQASVSPACSASEWRVMCEALP